jgi:ParB family chromosome partitioning protein
MITSRHLSTHAIREVISDINRGRNNANSSEDIFCLYPDTSTKRIQKNQKAFNKSIVALRIAMNKLSTIMQDLDDKEWYLAEILMQHKNKLHEEIDLLLKEKRKYISLPQYNN